jgi:hypothetical protein
MVVRTEKVEVLKSITIKNLKATKSIIRVIESRQGEKLAVLISYEHYMEMQKDLIASNPSGWGN